MASARFCKRSSLGLAALLAAGFVALAGQDAPGLGDRYKVTIKEEKAVIVETALPVDPTPRIKFQPAGLVAQVSDELGRTLHLSHFPTLNVDGQIFQNGGFGGFGNPQQGGRFEKQNQPLGNSAGGRARQGFTSVFSYTIRICA